MLGRSPARAAAAPPCPARGTAGGGHLRADRHRPRPGHGYRWGRGGRRGGRRRHGRRDGGDSGPRRCRTRQPARGRRGRAGRRHGTAGCAHDDTGLDRHDRRLAGGGVDRQRLPDGSRPQSQLHHAGLAVDLDQRQHLAADGGPVLRADRLALHAGIVAGPVRPEFGRGRAADAGAGGAVRAHQRLCRRAGDQRRHRPHGQPAVGAGQPDPDLQFLDRAVCGASVRRLGLGAGGCDGQRDAPQSSK